jgi:hypothetical protein
MLKLLEYADWITKSNQFMTISMSEQPQYIVVTASGRELKDIILYHNNDQINNILNQTAFFEKF